MITDRERVTFLNSCNDRQRETIQKLDTEIARLRETLGWYADGGNWSGHWSNGEEPGSEWVRGTALQDFGRRARKALEVSE